MNTLTRKLPSEYAGSEHPFNNLFFAFLPEKQAGSQVDRVAKQSQVEYGLTGRPLGLPRYHVSLYSLGIFPDVPSEFVAGLNEVFAPMAARTEPFQMRLDRVLSFENRRPKSAFVLGDSKTNWALMDFYRRLGRCLELNRTVFTPHVTLLYDVKRICEHMVDLVSWTVTELVLVRSYVGLGQHKHLARWPLEGVSSDPK
jgi:RNA 2',3'-cyclic 3'-phosphodiesterase